MLFGQSAGADGVRKLCESPLSAGLFSKAVIMSGDKVYAYQFARPLPTEDGTRQLEGAFHSADLWYVFGSMRHSNRPWTKGDVSISETMLTAWTNFAKTGNPGLGWEPYTKENPQYMIFKLDESGRNASAMGLPIDGSNVFHRTPFD